MFSYKQTLMGLNLLALIVTSVVVSGMWHRLPGHKPAPIRRSYN